MTSPKSKAEKNPQHSGWKVPHRTLFLDPDAAKLVQPMIQEIKASLDDLLQGEIGRPDDEAIERRVQFIIHEYWDYLNYVHRVSWRNIRKDIKLLLKTSSKFLSYIDKFSQPDELPVHYICARYAYQFSNNSAKTLDILLGDFRKFNKAIEKLYKTGAASGAPEKIHIATVVGRLAELWHELTGKTVAWNPVLVRGKKGAEREFGDAGAEFLRRVLRVLDSEITVKEICSALKHRSKRA